ncbi:MAG: peptide deformylase [Ignavibacteriota bacterium]
MSFLPIYTFDHPVLRKETDPITEDTADLQKFIAAMQRTMHHAEGIGLAANQVGRSLMMTVIDISGTKDNGDVPPLVLINPVITGTHGESVFEEGCLSLPEIREDVVRPESIGIKFFNEHLKEVEMEADKLLARVMQHEVDHLHGKYFIDYLSPLKLSFLKGKLNKLRKGEIETDYPLAPPSGMKKKKR